MNEQLIQAIQEWLEEHDLMTQLSKAAYHMLWSSRGPLRVYIPETELENGVVPQSEFADALMRIRVEALHPSQATVAHYGQVGVYTYQDSEEEDVAELTYLDEAGQTIIRSTAEGANEVIVPIGGRLTMYEMHREPIITESIRTLQRKLNHAATAENANLAQAGWITRLFMNAQMPGEYERDAEGNVINDPITGEPKFKPAPMTFGPETINFIAGIQTIDDEGNEKYERPLYIREEPVTPDTFLKTKADTKQAMLFAGRQAHVYLAVEAQASGESRLQARGDYENSLTLSAPQVEKAFVWAVETAVSMAAFFSGETSPLETLRVNAQAQLDLGVITPKERETAMNLFKSQLISHRRALLWCGIDNPDAEIAQIQAEAEAAAAATGTTAEGGAADGQAQTNE
ncbi:MAG: hypothetical protein KC421_06480 [Anaerolineales bacterium]|nr:hypothetical protein [Anaerolineales bacterium]